MSDEFAVGKIVLGSRYRVLRLIGQGGMGAVYEVEHVELGKRFVLKALMRELARRGDLVRRLREEWKALGRLEHPSIVTVTDAGATLGGVPYYVMERLKGENLAQRLRRGRLPMLEAMHIGADVLEALDAAHRIGVVHRDVKPPNVFLTDQGRTKLLDFGIAKLLDRDLALTVKGVAIGTPRYMSPEQASGDEVDSRSDLYAVGLVLFEMLTGRSPFEDCPPEEIFAAHLLREPPTVAELCEDIPAEVSRLVSRLLAKSPAQRPAGASAAAQVLRAMRRSYAPAAGADTVVDPRSGALTPASLAPASLAPGSLAPSQRPGVAMTRRAAHSFGPGLTASTVSELGPTWASPGSAGESPPTEVLGSEYDGEPTRTAVPVGATPPPVAHSSPPSAHEIEAEGVPVGARRLQLLRMGLAAIAGAGGSIALLLLLLPLDSHGENEAHSEPEKGAVLASPPPSAETEAEAEATPHANPPASASSDSRHGVPESTGKGSKRPLAPPSQQPEQVNASAEQQGQGQRRSALMPRRKKTPDDRLNAAEPTVSPAPGLHGSKTGHGTGGTQVSDLRSDPAKRLIPGSKKPERARPKLPSSGL